jgi:hypothetical protein
MPFEMASRTRRATLGITTRARRRALRARSLCGRASWPGRHPPWRSSQRPHVSMSLTKAASCATFRWLGLLTQRVFSGPYLAQRRRRRPGRRHVQEVHPLFATVRHCWPGVVISWSIVRGSPCLCYTSAPHGFLPATRDADCAPHPPGLRVLLLQLEFQSVGGGGRARFLQSRLGAQIRCRLWAEQLLSPRPGDRP